MKSIVLYIVTLSFFVGVFLVSIVSLTYTLYYLCLCIGIAFICVGLLSSDENKPLSRRGIFVAGLVLISTTFGMLRMSTGIQGENGLRPYIGVKAEYRGVVVSEPDAKDTTERFIVDVREVNQSPVFGKILVISNRYPEYHYGDELILTGTLKLPENFEVYAGGPLFDYVSYLQKDGVTALVYRPKIEKVSEGQGNPLVAGLLSMKKYFSESVERVIDEPESSLLLGLLVGDKSSLGTDILDDFRRAGLSHIIVLSGYNVTLVADSLIKAFSYVSIPLSPILGAISIIFFALMTGASATTVRASIMALLLIVSKRASRRYDVSRALVFAAFLMVLHNPYILVFDVSFQLSVLATIAIIYVAPLIRARIGWITERFMLRDIVATTVGTQLFVLPYILHVMGTLSLVAIVSNILVLPVVPTAMFSGFVTGIISFVSSLVATPLGWISEIILSYMIEVVHLSASLPFSALNISLPLFATVGLYILFVVFLYRIYKKCPVDTTGHSLFLR